MPAPRKLNTDERIGVIRLETPSQLEARTGRPRKLAPPPLPQELLDGMTDLEREHFDFFLDAYKKDYAISKPSDLIALQQAAVEYINLLRVQATQLQTGNVLTASRQHPAVQLRAWLGEMGATRSRRKGQDEGDSEEDEVKRWVARELERKTGRTA